jgi:hypothetical protein
MRKKQKGISMLFIILITGVIFTIALGINSILVQQTKMMGEVGFSVASFYAADSGAEQQLYDLYKNSEDEHQSSYEGILPNDASFIVTAACGDTATSCYKGIKKDKNCLAEDYCVDSIGKYKEIKRAIKIKY